MATRRQFIHPPFNLDPLLLLDDALADQLYDRVESLQEASGPNVWVLLMRAMYRILSGLQNRAGGEKIDRRSKVPESVKGISNASLELWAQGFNYAVASLTGTTRKKTPTGRGATAKAGRRGRTKRSGQKRTVPQFNPPKAVDKTLPPSSWRPPISINRADGGGVAAYNRYVGDEGELTEKMLNEMTDFRARVVKMFEEIPELQDPAGP